MPLDGQLFRPGGRGVPERQGGPARANCRRRTFEGVASVNPGFAAVLLAGGASTRMGSPKALLEFEGRPLWRRQVELLQSLNPSELMISAARDWEVPTGPWTVVRDRVTGLGPLGGMDAAMEATSQGLLLVLAVDMPSMSAGFLGGLVRSAGPKGVVPEDSGTYQGLAAVYPRSIHPLLKEVLGGGDRSLQFLVREAIRDGLVVGRPLSADERQLFRNLNRPADLIGQ
jgi:molybdenum cofactor guanylyltransferase